VKYGDYVAIFISAVGDHKSLRYSWKLNGDDVTGCNTRILVIKSCLLEHQGTYTCTVSNSRGEIESNPAHLKLGKLNNIRLAKILMILTNSDSILSMQSVLFMPIRCIRVLSIIISIYSADSLQ
jgi:hypothetical protein